MSFKFLEMARKFALEHEYDPNFEYRLCAIIVRGGKILSVGYNKRLTNSFTEHFKASEHVCSTHAECDAILKVRSKIDLTDAKIYVARVLYRGNEFGLAKPCEMCEKAIQRYGFKRAIYSISDKEYGTLKP